MAILISAEFLAQHRIPLSWSDLRWGLVHGLVDEQAAVDAAVRAMKGDPPATVVELAGLLPGELHAVPELLDRLAGPEADGSRERARDRWLYLVLLWLYEQRGELDDPLGAVEEVYADFGYPPMVAPFVRYMPVPESEGYRPQDHTPDENTRRLMRKWEGFLRGERDRLFP